MAIPSCLTNNESHEYKFVYFGWIILIFVIKSHYSIVHNGRSCAPETRDPLAARR